MSSILEALKKLEADKNAQQVAIQEPEPVYTSDQMAQSLLGNYADATPGARRQSPVLLVLGGALFTVLLIGVSVALAVFVLRQVQTPQQNAAAPAPTALAALTPGPAPAATADEKETEVPSEGEVAPPKVAAVAEAPKPKTRPKPEPQPEPEEAMVVTPVPVVSEVRYEPYIPKPAESVAKESAPVPEDIRTLPMLSRSDRAQYRLEGLTINMLNEASPTRPLGNALINLEKIFIGETLPGSNATLIDVKSHGIAIEIMSTRQRYYLPR